MALRVAKKDTRQILLRTAGDEFATHGYEKASLRAICQRAGTNVAAVKYHFGSKQELYFAVCEEAAEHMFAAEPMPRLEAGGDAAETLRLFIAWFMRLVLTEHKKRPWTGRLISHETIHPTPHGIDILVERCCKPVRDELENIIRGVVGPSATGRMVADLTYAVIALCVNPHHSREIYSKLGHAPPSATREVNRLASTIAELALSGLLSFGSSGGAKPC